MGYHVKIIFSQKMKKMTITKETAMARFMASKKKKQDYIKQLEKRMKAEYEKATGLQANYFEAL